MALLPLVVGAALASSWPPAHGRYDVVVLGTGLKESLLACLLAKHGKSVLQLERTGEASGSAASLDLQQLAEATEGPDAAPLSETKLGKPGEYSIERCPKMFLAAGVQLQLLVASGAWQHMNPPGFKRVQRAFMYRKRPDGQPDVHRVLANPEDVLKTRMLSALEKARVVQFFLWVDRYDEDDSRTHTTGPLSKKALDLRKLSAAKFLAHWELPKAAYGPVVRGMALHPATPRCAPLPRASPQSGAPARARHPPRWRPASARVAGRSRSSRRSSSSNGSSATRTPTRPSRT